MPRLTVTVPDQASQPYRFSLERQIVHFGRGDDNDIHIDSGSVSSEHCVMERIIGGYVLKDLGSTNGIKLNGERVDRISLRNGLNIEIGDVAFEFLLSDEEMTALRLEDPTSQLPPLNEPPINKLPDSVVETVDLKSPPPAPPKPELPQQVAPQPQAEIRPKPEPLPDLPPEPQPQVQPLPQIPTQPPVQVAPRHEAASPSESVLDDPKFNKLVAVLAAVAFMVGMALHFQRSTGESMLNALLHKVSGEKAAE